MVPAKTQCPTDWTVEYVGYLMVEHPNNNGRLMYECVDINPESVPGLNAGSSLTAYFHLVEPLCNGLHMMMRKNLLVLFALARTLPCYIEGDEFD